ncbi:GTPBP6 family protein [Megaselia abdita]
MNSKTFLVLRNYKNIYSKSSLFEHNFTRFVQKRCLHENEESNINNITLEDREYDSIAATVFQKPSIIEQRVLVIQPFVKWGPNKKVTKPELQIQEAESLIHSIENWIAVQSIKVPLQSLSKKTVFGKGKLDEIKSIISGTKAKGKPFTSIFISVGILTFAQKQFLTHELKLLILDRYSVVIQILRKHALSTESKIQVALAEIPYIWNSLKESSTNNSTHQIYLSESQKQILRIREKKLRNELEKVRNHRKLLRNKRTQKGIPVVSIVGYTNSGKTSLIQALTNDSKLIPRNQLFATLDVTSHSGYLPSNLQVIYMDTVGFMSDLPTELFECFVATLEDVVLSDLIIHVQDLSHENVIEQKKHVNNTLQKLFQSMKETSKRIPPVINVGNKIDLVSTYSGDNMNFVSSKTSHGLHQLLEVIEDKILAETDRKKMVLRVTNGGPEISWLYKNGAVTSVEADENNPNFLLVRVVISNTFIHKFKNMFLNKKTLN